MDTCRYTEKYHLIDRLHVGTLTTNAIAITIFGFMIMKSTNKESANPVVHEKALCVFHLKKYFRMRLRNHFSVRRPEPCPCEHIFSRTVRHILILLDREGSSKLDLNGDYHILGYKFVLDRDCVYQGRTRSHGSTWREDNCMVCTCGDGVVVCDQIVCPQLECANPVPPTQGQCCSSCRK